jgi:hypothetical protein
MGGGAGRGDDGIIGRHLMGAHEGSRGERQLADYVGRPNLGECVRVLKASPTSLASLVVLREEVIRTRTPRVLSGLEGG